MVMADNLSQSITIANPTGSAVDAQQLIIRIKRQSGTSPFYSISWGTAYAGVLPTGLPTWTVVGTGWLHLTFRYNSNAGNWKLVANINDLGYASRKLLSQPPRASRHNDQDARLGDHG